MKIETKLSLNILLPITTLLLMLLIISISMKRQEEAQHKNLIALSLLTDVFDLAQQTDYYLLYHENRTSARWYAIHNSMSSKIQGLDFGDFRQNTIIARMGRLLRELRDLFSALTNADRTLLLNRAFGKERQDRLSAQILERVRYASSQALRLYGLNEAEIEKSVRLRDTLVMGLLVVSVMFSVASLLPINKSISNSIKKLIEGAQAVGSGNLDFRIGLSEKNELGQLSQAFDEMTGRLKVITISRDELEQRVRDRTEDLRKQAEILNVTHDAIFVRDTHERIVLWNRGAEELYGWSSAEAIGKTTHDLLKTKANQPLDEIVAMAMAKGRWNGELLHVRKDGATITVDSRWALQRDERGNPLAILETNNDITQRKAAREALRKMNEELEQRVRERTAELTERTAQLETANKELESFSYSVSHDLRSPLRAIDGFSRMLLSDAGEKLGEDMKHKLEVIRHNAVMMGRLIDDLLSFSRLGRTELKRTRIDMGRIAREVVSEQTITSPEKGKAILVREMPFAYGDPSLIKQVFTNLVSNAIKFSRTEKTPRIEIGGFEREGEHSYYVKDNGVGFDMRYYDKLFAVFQRLHGQQEFEGTGVGLAIVSRIIKRHRGRVWAESGVGEGATFFFSLPAGEEEK